MIHAPLGRWLSQLSIDNPVVKIDQEKAVLHGIDLGYEYGENTHVYAQLYKCTCAYLCSLIALTHA